MTDFQEVRAEFNGNLYQYYGCGSGPVTLVILHGIGTSKDGARGLVAHFSENYQCFALDLPCHQGLPLGTITSLDDVARYVATFIDGKELTNVVVLGFSLGGMVALRMEHAVGHSEWLLGTIAWASPIMGEAGIQPKMLKLLRTMTDMSGLLFNVFSTEFFLGTALRVLGRHMSSEEIRAMSGFPQEALRAYAKLILSTEYSLDYSVPTLLIYGTHDLAVRTDNYKEARKHAGRMLEVELIERGGHFPNKQGYDAAVRRMEAFLTKLEKRA